MIIKKWSGSCSGGFSLNEYCSNRRKKRRLLYSGIQIVREKREIRKKKPTKIIYG